MYELMYVVNTVLNDEQVKDIVERVTGFIRESGGDIVEVQEKGSQRLAYPIEKKRNGYYTLTYFRADGDFIERFERALRINDDIMRHLILRYDAKMMRHFEKQQRQPAEAEAEAS
ncbi:MAG: 30S ribosomal protein S6 [Bacteroidota bacterium]